MSEKELQDEEREVLLSIYEGDEAFKELSADTYQYKYGETDDIKSFLVEIKWGPNYPNEAPAVNMDTFYNKHLVDEVKNNIKQCILSEAEQWLGSAMTYTLFECIKEKIDDLLKHQPDKLITSEADISDNIEKININDNQEISKKLPKKEQLSKAQKRRAWDRMEGGKGGERPRGWDWIDIVKHLSQTGGKESDITTST